MLTNFATADLPIAFAFAASIEPRKPGFPIGIFAFLCGYSGHIIFLHLTTPLVYSSLDVSSC